MKRDGEKRSHCLTVSRIWHIRMQSLGWWVIGLRPGLAYPCLSLNSLCLGQYKVESWDGEPSAWRSVSASQTSDFRPPSHPNTRSTSVPVSVATRAAGRGGRKKRQNKRKGCRAAPFDKLHAHPTILMSPHARQGHGSHPLGELWSPAGLGGTCRPAGKSVWSPRIPLGPKSNEKRSTIQSAINLHSEWTGGAANTENKRLFCLLTKAQHFQNVMKKHMQKHNIFKERETEHLPEGSDDCCNFFIWIKLSNCMMGPQQFLPIFPPRNSCTVLVHVRYVDGAIKLDIFVFRKYYMANRVIKRKGW